MKTNAYLGYLAHFFLEWKIVSSKCVEKLETIILYLFFYKIVPVMR